MALGNLRQFAQFQSDQGVFYKVEIYDAQWSGSSTEFNIGGEGFSMKWDGSISNRYDPIHASTMTFTFFAEDATDDTFVTDVNARDQGDIKVKILRGTSVNPTTLWWCGTILNDIRKVYDASYPKPIEYKAVCGLTLLKGIEYSEGGFNPAAGDLHGLNRVIQEMLFLTNTGDFYSASDTFLRTVVNWREDSMPTAGTNVDPLDNSAVYPRKAFVTKDTQGNEVKNTAYKVLEEICKCFGARVYQCNGIWNVIQPDMYAHQDDGLSSVYGGFRLYDYNRTLDGTGAFNESYAIDNTSIIQLAGRYSKQLPAFKRVDFQYGNWGNGVFNTTLPVPHNGSGSATWTTIGTVANGVNIMMTMHGNAVLTQTSGTLQEDMDAYFILGARVTETDGTIHYLQSNFAFSTSGVGYAWVPFNLADNTFNAAANSNFTSETQMISGTQCGFQIPAAGELAFNITFLVENTYTQVDYAPLSDYTCTDLIFTGIASTGIFYTIGNTDLADQGRIFQSNNNTGNLIASLGTCSIGDGPELGSDGMIRVQTSSDPSNPVWNYEVNEDWKSFTTGDPERITALASRDYLAGQNTSVETTFISLQHKSNKLFDFSTAYTNGGKTYYPLTGTLIANTDIFRGTLVNAYFATQGVISSDFTYSLADVTNALTGADSNAEDLYDEQYEDH